MEWECRKLGISYHADSQCIFFDQTSHPPPVKSPQKSIENLQNSLFLLVFLVSAITGHSEDWLIMEFWKYVTEGKGLLLPEELELPAVDMVKIGKKVSGQMPQELYDTSNFTFVSNDQIGQEKDVEFEAASSVVESGGLELATADFKIGGMAESNSIGVQEGESSKDAVTLSSSMTTKRAPLSSMYSQAPTCQVHGCNKDLSSFKGYYKRHKVCDAHTKTAQVIVKGIEQRFCQQCSRFHLLAEFDDEKRSCRKRLANHNERRRKPQGTRRTSFLSQETLPTGFSGPSKHGTGKWFGHMKLEDPNLDSSSSLIFHDNISVGTLDETISITMPSDPTFSHIPDSSCALSLLSSQSQNASEHLLETTVGPTATDASNHVGTSKHCHSSGQGTMVDLLQLSSHLQMVEKKRKLMR